MPAEFSKNVYYGYILKGDLTEAVNYVGQFPEQAVLYHRLMDIFEKEQYVSYDVPADLDALLSIYQRYYRDVFYLCIGKEEAGSRLRAGLVEFFGIEDESTSLDDMEQNQVAGAFQSSGLHFLGGRTSGYYGPYVWRTTERMTYQVELPDGAWEFTVKLLDGFIARSWTDYLTFGEIGTGGWTDQDGVINCVKSAYDLESEAFKVSLLKHEAQHASDLKACPDMSSAALEYRAKLVELIYSSERNLLARFAQEADSTDRLNGHAFASARILDDFARKSNLSSAEVERLPIPQVQAIARALYGECPRRRFSVPQ